MIISGSLKRRMQYFFSFAFVLLFIGKYCDAVDSANACTKGETYVQNQLANKTIKEKFVSQFIFANDTKPNITITWAGKHTLIVVTLITQGLLTRMADVYRSTNDGRTFEKITASIDNSRQLLVEHSIGLQRNPVDPNRIYLVCHDASFLKSIIYYTADGGATWNRSDLNFQIQSLFQFHPTNVDLVLTQSGSMAYASINSGVTWFKLKDHVFKVSWGVDNDTAGAVYAAVETPGNPSGFLSSLMQGRQQLKRSPSRQLVKSDDLKNWHVLADSIYSYSNKGNFVFISKADSDSTDMRHLEVSTDFGKTFVRTQLPSATPDRFFAILDMFEGVVFVHMDGGNYQGFGTLYTSDSHGQVFSKSLERHFYPPVGSSSDFYRVDSMRGTFLTTVLHSDNSMHSVITHNRGAMWQTLEKPEGASCLAESTPCYLQVASQYGISRGVLAEAPYSTASATGLVVVHGHAATNLQTGLPDVFVSSDGGYSWRKALTGPHHVQIGNNGNFLVAIQLGVASPKEVKFSTDAGRCWHTYTFTSENYTYTGMFTEPGNRALTVAIWGFMGESHHWRVFTVDLGQLLTQQCKDDNYEPWLTNGAINYGEGEAHRACVFGAKETIKRLKPDSMCQSDYTYTPSTVLQPCNCTEEDYECEFGYTRGLENNKKCVPDKDIPEPELCINDQVVKFTSDGYRKLPGNRCQGGFQPKNSTMVVIRQGCPKPTEDPRIRDGRLLIAMLAKERQDVEEAKSRRTIGIVAPLCITVAILLGVVLTLVILARLRERRRRQLAFHYSVVSATGRKADADLEYQPADGILNGTGPRRAAYSATSETVPSGGKKRRAHWAEDKQQLVDRSEDEDLIS